MIITPSERRRAEQFEALLDGRASQDADIAPLLAIGARLRSVDIVSAEIDPVFRDRLRTRLLAVASVQGVGEDLPDRPTRRELHQQPQPQRRMPRRIALAAGTVTALVALSGVGAASGGAVPGDTLYSVKRSREAAQLALARTDLGRGQLHYQFARTRLTEAVTVRDDSAALSRALTEMDADTRLATRELTGAALDRQDRTPLDVIDEFVAIQRRQLIGLIGMLPREQRAKALNSLSVLEDVRARSGSLRPALLCSSGLAGAAQVDELGPLPRRCAALPGAPAGTTPSESGPPEHGADPFASPLPGSVVPAVPPLTGGPSGSGQNPPSPSGPGAKPSPSPSGGTQGMLGTVTDTVGGVVGGVLDPLGGDSAPVLP